MARVVFQKFLNKDDFGMSATADDIACNSAKWTEIGSYQVPAQQEIAFGVGKVSDGGVDSRRNATIRVDDASGQIAGKLRLAYADANEVTVQPIQEDLISNWASGVPLAEVTKLRVREDSYLKILVRPDTSTTVDMSDTDNQVDVPVTIYVL